MCVCARAPPKPFAMSPSIFCNVVQNYSLCVYISTCAGGGHPDDDLSYCHLSKLNLVKESDRPFNGMPIRF